MKNIYLPIFISLFSFVSCQNLDTNKNPNFEKILDSISNVYDGKIELSSGVELTDRKKINYIEIDVKNSLTLNDYQNFKHLPASNIAYIMHGYLKNDSNLSSYRVNLNYGSDLKKYEYSKDRLDSISKCYLTVINLNKVLKNENYNTLKSLLKIDIENVNKFIKSQEKFISDYGSIEDQIITGYSYNKLNTGLQFLKIYLISKHSKHDVLTTIYLDLDNCDIIGLENKWTK